MKILSIIKAILSGLVWGLGQVFNKQFLKGLFFFVFFIGFLSVEFFTGKYTEEIDPYDKIQGNAYGESWVRQRFFEGLSEENFNNPGSVQYVYDYIDELGGAEFLTEDLLIKFIAQDLKENNQNGYMNLGSKTLLEEQPDDTNKIHIIRKEVLLWDDVNNVYYEEKDVTVDGVNKKEYYQRENHLTEGYVLDESGNPVTLSTEQVTEFVRFEKTGDVYFRQNNYFVGVKRGNVTTINQYLRLSDGAIVSTSGTYQPRPQVVGPIYRIPTAPDATTYNLYEYFEPELPYLGTYLQYNDTPLTKAFKNAMNITYNGLANSYTNTDYTFFILRVYFELHPEIKEVFESGFNHFFYDKAGLFVRGYWAVFTLGETRKVEYKLYSTLSDALLYKAGEGGKQANLLPSVPLQGHISTQLLLEGLIGVILSLFFLLFMIWSIRDAYRVSEAKRMKEKVEGDITYFKSVWENGFEYIVLSPALFVLAFISIMPIAFGFVIAFTNISGNESMMDTFNWVGLENFFAIFNFSGSLGASYGVAFWRVLGWTIVWAIFSTFTVFFGGFIQALIINNENVIFRKLWRTILILPWAIPALLSQMVFAVMFNEHGFVNQVLIDVGVYEFFQNLGILGVDYESLSGLRKIFYLGPEDIQWFKNPFNPNFVRATLIVVNIWLGFPYFMALMTSVMTAIDKTLYEAADIDGATRWQKIKSITIPLVMYSTAPILIMTFSGNFNNFGVIYFITGGGPNEGHFYRGFAGDTDILISWMYKLTVDEAIYNMASVFSVLIFLFVGSVTAWNLSRTRAFQED